MNTPDAAHRCGCGEYRDCISSFLCGPGRDAAPKRSLANFISLAEDRRNRGERQGQAYFNTLYFDGFDPEFADAIRATELDPFYDDGRIGLMLDALRERWAE